MEEEEKEADSAEVWPTPGRPRRGHRGLPSMFQLGAATWTWLGVGVAAAGFILIVVGWGQVAAETRVALQLPYVVSAGFVGLSLVMLGLMLLNINSRHRDAIDRDRQTDHLAAIIEELKDVLREGHK